MSNRGQLIRSRNMLRAAIGGREPKRPIFRALTGDGTGGDTRTHVRVDDEPTRMYVRVEGRGVLEAVVATNVPMRHDVPVYVGPTQENPDVYEVLGINFSEIESPGGYAYVPSHHWSHEFGSAYGADDVVWINKEQFLPFLAAPTDPPSTDLYVYPGFYLYLTDWQYFPGGLTGDLTAYNPAAGLAKYILISINAVTNVIAITDGVAFAPFPPSNPATRIPACPAAHFPLMAVYLLDTTATITWDNLYDVRLMVGGGVNTEVPGPHHLIDTIVHDDTVAHHAPVEGDLILANNDTPNAWDVLAAAGNSWRLLRSTATSCQWSLFDWDNLASAGGDMVHDHSGVNEGGDHLRPYRLALQDDLQDMGGAANYQVLWNSYVPLTNAALFDTYVQGVWDWDGAAEYGSIIFLNSDSDPDGIAFRTWVSHRWLGNNRDIVLAGGTNPGFPGRDYSLGDHPLLLVRNRFDNKWYEIAWTGSGGGVGAHNILSATHGDSEADVVNRGAMITGQLNHPGAVLAWTRLDFPGDRHHLQTDDQDIIWDLDISMEPGHWIGLGDATGYGTGQARIKFNDGGLGRDVIANLDADVGVGTENPNIAGEAVALTIESAVGTPTLELSRLDDILPADAIIGVIRWFSGDDSQCAQAQIDVVQTGYYEGESVMEFWAADDCALCHVMDLSCDEVEMYVPLNVHDEALSSAATFYGVRSRFVKTGGVGAAGDDYYGMYSHMELNQSTTIDNLFGGYSYGLLTTGTADIICGSYSPATVNGGTVNEAVRAGHHSATVNGGTVQDVLGTYTFVHLIAGTVNNDVFGHYIYVDDDVGASGTVSMLYLDERTGVDYGIYQNGNSPNVLGGTVAAVHGDNWALEDYHAGAPVENGYVRVDINGAEIRLLAYKPE